MSIAMYNVKFPGLGLDFTVSPIAFSIGSLHIRWYAIILTIGFLAAYFYTISCTQRFKINKSHFSDAVLVGLVSGIVCARIYYVIFYSGNEYITNPISVFYIWQGGIAIYGGLIGGILGGAIVAKKHGMNIWATLDLASFGFLIGQSIGRWGNFVNQEAFGTQTQLPWRMVSAATGGVGVHPCFLYESIWCTLGFFVLSLFSKKNYRSSGQIFAIYMIWYAIGRFFIEALRTDSLILINTPIKISQLVAIATILFGVGILVFKKDKSKLKACSYRGR